MRVEPFLKDAVGEHQDRGRDDVPPGYVWSMLDFVPRISGATLRGRGRWFNMTNAFASAPQSLVWAPFTGGGKLIAVTNGQAWEIPPGGGPGGETLIGTANQPFRSNPHFYRNKLYLPASGFVPRVINSALAISSLSGVGAAVGEQIHSFRDRLVSADLDRLWFAQPGDPTILWDGTSFIDFDGKITGLKAMRNKLLVFHGNFVEQLTGTTPPDSALSNPTGDMSRDVMWEAAGCYDARSISGWQENVIFADERGVHLTDGGLVRNMIEQGGMSRVWRTAFERGGGGEVDAVGGAVYGNIYICTVLMNDNASTTWVCDIPTRRWHRWTNIKARAHAVTVGNVERIFGTDTVTKKVISMENCLNPSVLQQVDGNGVNVLPVVETAWLRVSRRVGMRRFYDAFVSYLCADNIGGTTADMVEVSYTSEPEDVVYEVIGTLDETTVSKRRKLLFARRHEGIAFKIRALLPFTDFRVHDIGVSVEAEEEHRT
jgi:hypothetical protein